MHSSREPRAGGAPSAAPKTETDSGPKIDKRVGPDCPQPTRPRAGWHRDAHPWQLKQPPPATRCHGWPRETSSLRRAARRSPCIPPGQMCHCPGCWPQQPSQTVLGLRHLAQAGRAAETRAENNYWLNYCSSQGEAINTESLPEREHLPDTDFAFTWGPAVEPCVLPLPREVEPSVLLPFLR